MTVDRLYSASYDGDTKEGVMMNETQLQIDVDAETKRRIELAAAEKNISVSDYLLTAARLQLVRDGILEPDQDDSAQHSLYDPDLP